MLLEVCDISKSFDSTTVLREVCVSVYEGEILCLLGPSGCGKSTLLRIIAGLERAESGQIRYAGRSIDRTPVHERGFGLMFQDFALFPHRSVAENVAFGLRMQRLPRAEITRRVAEALQLVGLSHYADRTIYELSGGERQRVALARSLAPRPRLLMLDEPLGSLDRTLRERLSEDLRQLIKQLELTAIYVTHDQAESFAIADRIALMQAGRIVQLGRPGQLYRCPRTPFVARFLGLNTLVPGRIVAQSGDLVYVETSLGRLCVDQHMCDRQPDGAALVVIRPEAAQPATERAPNLIEGAIVRRTFQGASERVVLRHATGTLLTLNLDPALIEEQQVIRLSLQPAALSLMRQTVEEQPPAATDDPSD